MHLRVLHSKSTPQTLQQALLVLSLVLPGSTIIGHDQVMNDVKQEMLFALLQ